MGITFSEILEKAEFARIEGGNASWEIKNYISQILQKELIRTPLSNGWRSGKISLDASVQENFYKRLS